MTLYGSTWLDPRGNTDGHGNKIDTQGLLYPSVPDGGLTIGMLAAALGGLGFMRRKLSRRVS